MALEFYKRRFRKPSKKVQYILAFTALLLAMALAFSWMMFRHQLEQARDEASSDDSSDSSVITYTDEDAADLLVIVNDDETARFILVHADPKNKAIRVTNLPEDAITTDGLTLTALYQKHGSGYVVSQLAARTGRPLRHYLSISRANTEKWFARLGNDLAVTLKNDIVISNESGTQNTLTAGAHTLNATQATKLILHTEGDEIIAAMLRQYLQSKRNLSADFSSLANLSQTSIRIGDFTGYRDKLKYLADQNSEQTCSITTQSYDDIIDN